MGGGVVRPAQLTPDEMKAVAAGQWSQELINRVASNVPLYRQHREAIKQWQSVQEWERGMPVPIARVVGR
jgi:hypothetical protein